MLRLHIADIAAALCAGAAAMSALRVLRARPLFPAYAAAAVAFGALAVWAAGAAIFLHAPLSPLRARAVLTAGCLVHLPWLLAVLALSERDFRTGRKRWAPILAGQAVVAASAAALCWRSGLDWVTGIGSEPMAVLTRTGLLSTAAGSVPAFVALVLLAGRFRLVAAIPSSYLGIAGASAALLWLSSSTLLRGYLTAGALTSAVALAGAASLAWTLGAGREMPAGPRFAPSRRLVYLASVVALAGAYFLAAGATIRWAQRIPHAAIAALLPAAAFAALAALVFVFARWRHVLQTAINRHIFGSKHDYGEIWIKLTELLGAARTQDQIIERTARFCRELLRAPEARLWTLDTSGRLIPAATAIDNGASGRSPTRAGKTAAARTRDANGVSVPYSADPARLAADTGASFAYPLLVNGRPFGALTIGSIARPAFLDDEDRRLLEHIAAQLSSVIGLHRLGEEIADAREVASFHRLSAFLIHDLKNLVAQQSFVLENAKKFGADPRFVTDALAAFEDSTHRMRSIIMRLREPDPEGPAGAGPTDLLEVLRDLLAAPGLARHPHPLRLVPPEDADCCRVPADKTSLAQVFSNLLVNAVESLAAGDGEVTVSVAAADGGWRVDVKDNGKGIPADFARRHLFRPFRTTKDGGLGIGLYQCRTIIDGLGGSIGIDSAENAGTTVTVVLPAYRTHEESHERRNAV